MPRLKIGPQALCARTDFVKRLPRLTRLNVPEGWDFGNPYRISKATKLPDFDDCLGLSKRYLRQFKELHKRLLQPVKYTGHQRL